MYIRIFIACSGGHVFLKNGKTDTTKYIINVICHRIPSLFPVSRQHALATYSKFDINGKMSDRVVRINITPKFPVEKLQVTTVPVPVPAQTAGSCEYSTPIKPKEMENFALFRAHLAMCGIVERQSTKQSHPLNFKQIAIIASSLYGISTIKLLDDASTFDEYTDIIYRVFFISIIFLSYVNIVWKSSILFGLIHRLEDIINKSKFSIEYL